MFEDFKEMSMAKICTESKSINLIFLIFFFSLKTFFFFFIIFFIWYLPDLFLINIASCSPISQSLRWMEVVGDGSKL